MYIKDSIVLPTTLIMTLIKANALNNLVTRKTLIALNILNTLTVLKALTEDPF